MRQKNSSRGLDAQMLEQFGDQRAASSSSCASISLKESQSTVKVVYSFLAKGRSRDTTPLLRAISAAPWSTIVLIAVRLSCCVRGVVALAFDDGCLWTSRVYHSRAKRRKRIVAIVSKKKWANLDLDSGTASTWFYSAQIYSTRTKCLNLTPGWVCRLSSIQTRTGILQPPRCQV
jgi:hypothetical protein